ncbi:hypothetical protein LCGC14_2235210 [marine sediment metagenome]|uniref:Uncharacterized protein n=1 Tax=marine sediment metagenome TaxID=412755 RepID=A0A0F9D6U2_9ZZZZ
MIGNDFVIIKDMSAGNESVGEMWQETKIFDGENTLNEVMDWAIGDAETSKKHIQITKPEPD